MNREVASRLVERNSVSVEESDLPKQTYTLRVKASDEPGAGID